MRPLLLDGFKLSRAVSSDKPTCWPRSLMYSTGILTALAISNRSCSTAIFVRSCSGSSVSRTAYRATSARSSGVPRNLAKIWAAGRSSLVSSRYVAEMLAREYESWDRFLRNHCITSSCITPGVSREKNLFMPYALELSSFSRTFPPPESMRPNLDRSTRSAPVASSTRIIERPWMYRQSNPQIEKETKKG